MDCIFCKIVKGEIPCAKIYEDKEFLAFLSIGPVNKGHTLVIPKEHSKNLFDFPKAEESDLVEFLKKVADAVVKGTGADGFNLSLNNGKAAGQLVFHTHFHIIPRFNNDGLKSWPEEGYINNEEMEDYRKKISDSLD
ncbi:HIT family protein [Candidatus Woesearchaeota archaeon]|nr:HIT family protein [Candidatus Woesearchaeota archaeon]